jgi:esterase/lipase superfamily enzyme
MQREYHRWYSHRLGLELGVIVHGHWGAPILGFPTSAGDENELEGQSMIGALAEFIDGGRIKFFSINSINGSSFYNKSAHPFHRSYVQSVFDSYLREEVSRCNRDHGRLVRRVPCREFPVQTSRRYQALLCNVWRVRRPKFSGWDVRRQSLLQ